MIQKKRIKEEDERKRCVVLDRGVHVQGIGFLSLYFVLNCVWCWAVVTSNERMLCEVQPCCRGRRNWIPNQGFFFGFVLRNLVQFILTHSCKQRTPIVALQARALSSEWTRVVRADVHNLRHRCARNSSSFYYFFVANSFFCDQQIFYSDHMVGANKNEQKNYAHVCCIRLGSTIRALEQRSCSVCRSSLNWKICMMRSHKRTGVDNCF